jgi:diphosphomevalonate decarboxylase
VVAHLDRLRALAGVRAFARVTSANNFPSDAGIASSAAAFAALTLAGAAALELGLDERELSRLARRSGSGSASRSIPSGYVEWYAGDDDATSVAEMIAPPEHWDLADIVAVVDARAKKIGSAENHQRVTTSPYFDVRLRELPARLATVRRAIAQRDLPLLGAAIEADAVSMHTICMTQVPPSFYWSAGTMAVIHAIHAWREEGLPAYFTIDAGPNVHIICEAADRLEVQRRLAAMPEVMMSLENRPGPGARLVAAQAAV